MQSLEFCSSEMSLGIPIKVLHEAESHVITCETSTGEVFRGKLVEAEEHMNIQVKEQNLIFWRFLTIFFDILRKIIDFWR